MANWKNIIKSVAPTLAGVLGGPGASLAVKVIGEQFLGDENASIEDIEQAVLGAKPEDLAKLKDIEYNFKARMKELDINVLELTTKDRQHARDFAQKTSLKPQMILTLLFVGGYFGLLYLLFGGVVQLDPTVRDPANILLGALSAGIPMILKFWFGESPNADQVMERVYRSTPKD